MSSVDARKPAEPGRRPCATGSRSRAEPWTNTTAGPLAGACTRRVRPPAGRARAPGRASALARLPWSSTCAAPLTYRQLYVDVTYRLYVAARSALASDARALLAAARALFAERGYADVGTEEIVRARGGHARRALPPLPRQARPLPRRPRADRGRADAPIVARDGGGRPRGGLVAGVRAFLDACGDPALIRIGLLDAPAVLGWEEWRRSATATASAWSRALGGDGRGPVAPPTSHARAPAARRAGRGVDADRHRRRPRRAREQVEGPLLLLINGLRA